MLREFRRYHTAILGAVAALTVFATPALADSFYQASPADLNGPIGGLIRAEVLDLGPPGASTYRILYRSLGLNDKPIAVSGIVIRPAGHNPASGRPIVAWAHPTTGIARQCAPTLLPNTLDRIQGISAMLDRGYVVVATDYPGLGTAGVHPYLIGVSEGRAVIDSVRAIRGIGELGAGNTYAVWGHSQGGHAVLFAGEMAAHYAPEIKLVGVAAAAPATELGALFEDDINSEGGKVLTSYTIRSWSELFQIPVNNLATPRVLSEIDRIARDCINSVEQLLSINEAAQPILKGQFLLQDPTKIVPWKDIMNENTPGKVKAGAPVYISQGLADKTVDPQVTIGFARHLCKQGAPVDFQRYPGVSHTDIAKVSAHQAVAWMADRFAGRPAPSNCGG